VIRSIEARHYRCLRDVRVELGSFHVLVGPNGSGKTTFLDVPALLRDLLQLGFEESLRVRGSLESLVWRGEGDRFDLAVELEIPEDLRKRLDTHLDWAWDRVRYELAIGRNSQGDLAVMAENLWFKLGKPAKPRALPVAPPPAAEPWPNPEEWTGWHPILTKEVGSGHHIFYAETPPSSTSSGSAPRLRTTTPTS